MSKSSIKIEKQAPTMPEYKEPRRQLPAHFAEEMLFCELELEKDEVDLKVLNKLLELYTVTQKF